MLVFINFSRGMRGGVWYLGPALLMLPLFLNFLDVGMELLESALETLAYLSAPLIGRQRAGAIFGMVYDLVLVAVVLLALGWAVRWAYNQWREHGWRGLLRSSLLGTSGGWGQQGGGATRPGQAAAANGGASGKERWERVAEALQRLPTQTVASRKELEACSVHELRSRLAGQGLSTDGALEKSDLVAALLGSGGSSGATCSICYCDYEPGDELRVLPCKHRFHLECVDKWLLSSTDYSRPPACPNCNTPLLQPPQQTVRMAAAGAGARRAQ